MFLPGNFACFFSPKDGYDYASLRSHHPGEDWDGNWKGCGWDLRWLKSWPHGLD